MQNNQNTQLLVFSPTVYSDSQVPGAETRLERLQKPKGSIYRTPTGLELFSIADATSSLS